MLLYTPMYQCPGSIDVGGVGTKQQSNVESGFVMGKVCLGMVSMISLVYILLGSKCI